MRTDKLLLVDDEQGLLDMLSIVLKREGFQNIETATTGQQALDLVKSHTFDLILLDVMLPDLDGFEVCRRIRAFKDIPILFVTARASDLDKLMGLGIGGDDYITKPFNPLEVAARIQVQLRRQAMFQRALQQESEEEEWNFGSFILNKNRGELLVAGQPVHCTAKEFELLSFLCAHPHRVFTISQLYESVWDATHIGDEKTVVIHISKLRKKIEKNPRDPKIIINLRGIGYKFIPPER
ncbi:response regulator transcription factor [Thermoflavimicrobium daqui]|jgi:DNA-binding response OmpR family regulator|uniref:DNA-binding response regulator n=1 Tax=Thermoflavimicrobium daqui TaxID=2137476 RepID=A0A364K9J1_9BACL|nr:response regulator transcription factor [Thermoflavimicrobium daqui]RAL26870.1 DNA-binding response regulator [Thermoflavimicrobium daqui]